MKGTGKKYRYILLALLLAGSLSGLTGCHGKEGLSAFVIPEEFDGSRQYGE